MLRSRLALFSLTTISLIAACSDGINGVNNGSSGSGGDASAPNSGGAVNLGGETGSGGKQSGSGGDDASGGAPSGGADGGGGTASGGTDGGGGTASGGTDGSGGNMGSGGGTIVGGNDAEDLGYPMTCAQAPGGLFAETVGCEFWATQTYNPVYTDFEFGVVITNAGSDETSVTITGPGSTVIVEVIAAESSKAISLPWVSALKGPEFSRTNTSGGQSTVSVRANSSAFKIVSTRPVAVSQFNPLPAKLSGISGCSGTNFGSGNCYAVTGDGTSLIPQGKLTGNAVVLTRSGAENGIWGDTAGGVAITATRDTTSIQIRFANHCGNETYNPGNLGPCVASGTGVTAASAGDLKVYSLNAGDVLQLLGNPGAGSDLVHADLSGSVLNADKPIQVIAFNPLVSIPNLTSGNSDHLEASIPPAETWGKKYSVYVPTSPSGAAKGGHYVRLVGLASTTNLTYSSNVGGPASLAPQQVVEFGPVSKDFQVTGSEAFAAASLVPGGSLQGAGSCPDFPCYGDPAMTMLVPEGNLPLAVAITIPSSYERHYLDIALANVSDEIRIDGVDPQLTGENNGDFFYGLFRTSIAAGQHLVSTNSSSLYLRINGSDVATSWTDLASRRFEHLSVAPSVSP